MQTTRSLDYRVLDVNCVGSYVAGHPILSKLVDADSLQAREVGDGNLNLIFVCTDARGRSLCLKQALPYVRLVGEAWPLTPARALAEARAYEVASVAAPEYIPRFYGVDETCYVLAMEDLSHWRVWRGALNEGLMHLGAAEAMGRYVARVSFFSSVFGLDAATVKKRVADSMNPELCDLTESVVFTEPYIDHERNRYGPELAPYVDELRRDEVLTSEVQFLKYVFMTRAEALIHGDLHTGSVMVGGEGDIPAKAFDPEFAYYGPIGFDLGALIGNYMMARVRADILGRPPEFRAWVQHLSDETWFAFEVEMRALWQQRVDRFLGNGFLDRWLMQIARDSLGFAGCKAIRRIIGVAKVADIETLPAEQHLRGALRVLAIARRWILERSHASTPPDLLALADQIVVEETGR